VTLGALGLSRVSNQEGLDGLSLPLRLSSLTRHDVPYGCGKRPIFPVSSVATDKRPFPQPRPRGIRRVSRPFATAITACCSNDLCDGRQRWWLPAQSRPQHVPEPARGRPSSEMRCEMVGGMVTAHHNLVGSARVSTVSRIFARTRGRGANE